MPAVWTSLGNPSSEAGAQDEQELLAELGEWHNDMAGLIDATAEEVNVGELPGQLAGWAKSAGTEAASSLTKQAVSFLPRNPPSLPMLRQRGTGVSDTPSKRTASSRGWLSGTVSGAMALLSGSPHKRKNRPYDQCAPDVRGTRVGRHGLDERVIGGSGAVRRNNSDPAERLKSDRTRHGPSDDDYVTRAEQRGSSTRSRRVRSHSVREGVDDDSEGARAVDWEHVARRESVRSSGSGSGKGTDNGDSAQRTNLRHASGRERGVRGGGRSAETLQTQLLRMPYYLFQGLLLITFVTDKVADMDSLSDTRKKILVGVMALAMGNFFSSTTTARSNVLFLALRSVCDAFNITHALVLILLSIWSPALSDGGRVLAAWLAQYPSLSVLLGISQPLLGPVLGTFNLITGLLRVAADLKIDTHPLPSELPVVVIGLILICLIPANASAHASDEAWGGAAVCSGCVSDGGAADVHLLGREVGKEMRNMPWCSCHVLTTSLVVALMNLAAPPQRSIRMPLMVMMFNFVWASAVACAGVLSGPAALPWPGLAFFTTLAVVSLLISKHLLV